MPTFERPVDRGTRLARAAVVRIGLELRQARSDRGLSLIDVGSSVGVSKSELSRIELGQAPMVPLFTLGRLAAAVGLDLSARLYPGGQPIRDRPQVTVLNEFRAALHRSLRWATEVPVPIAGDPRAWDAVVASVRAAPRGVAGAPPNRPASPSALASPDWRYGVEVETLPRDAQATNRRIQAKLRDSGLDGALLVIPDTRRARLFVAEALPELQPSFPIPGRRAMELLRAGADPGGSSLVLLARSVGSPSARPR
jgi:transcriptional regulator with XRE-family HTH domain